MSSAFFMPQGMIGAMHGSVPSGNPSSNNQPLQFNQNKGRPPMPVVSNNGGNEGRERKDSTSSQSGPTDNVLQPQMPIHGPGFLGSPIPGMGFHGPMMGPDPSMMMMSPMGFNQFGGFMGPVGMGPGTGVTPAPSITRKEVITLKSCVLYPPPPGAPPPSTRERPLGCRTIFVGGLPENITEEILQEIFDRCNTGNICSIRHSKKNFAHIRFEFEECVDQALYLSGYRLKIDDKDDKANTGRLHVDFATARDDQYEWECKQRQLAREIRHRQRLEEERLRPPSPPPIIHYSDHESTSLVEHLKNDESFLKAAQVLITWLDRGNCNRRTVNTFYSMLQCTNSHVRRLLNEKQQHEEEVQKTKDKFRQRFEGILRQFDQIEKVFSTAQKQKSWDHFSKAQRKNVDLWLKQIQEIKISQQEEFLNEYQDDAMEMSDGEDGEPSDPPPGKRKKYDADEINNMQYENDSLKCQVEAYKNEVDLARQETQNSFEEKDKQIKLLQQALQGMQQQLIAARQQLQQSSKGTGEKPDKGARAAEEIEKSDDAVSSTGLVLTEREVKLVGLISCFLNVHPPGATPDYIWSYLHHLEIPVRTSEIEDLMEKVPMLFQQKLSGVGATIERRWKFVGFVGNTNVTTME